MSFYFRSQKHSNSPLTFIAQKMSKKIAKALIGGNWKCNGTVSSVASMVEVLNKGGPFSPNSEVVIAAPSIHLQTLKTTMRPDVAISSEVTVHSVATPTSYKSRIV
jgi:hypothetical protein